jgi:HAD superfamily hydrolase (TIGR01490 family)
MGQVAALFDMDKTLLDVSSGQHYARYSYRQGRMGRKELIQVAWLGVLSWLGILNMDRILPRLLAEAAGDDEREMRLFCDRWFEEDLVSHITERGRQRVLEHQEQGHVVAIVSGSTQYAVAPVAAHLGMASQYVCTHLESRDGLLTGQILPPVCYGPGKVVWAERLAAEHDVDLGASYFYTDSISDLPLLESVGHPVAVNPDPRLRRLARKQGWPIEIFY